MRHPDDPAPADPYAADPIRWRVGRKLGRTIYEQLGDQPGDDDPVIGMMDTAELAAQAVRGHNAAHQFPAAYKLPDVRMSPELARSVAAELIAAADLVDAQKASVAARNA